MKSWCVFAACLLLMAVSTVGNAEEQFWVGIYRASSIPGYIIVGETRLVTAEYSGPQREGEYLEVLEIMKQACLKQQGVALVNIIFTPTIGDIRGLSSRGESNKVFTPGLHIVGLADCVLKVIKGSR